MQRYQHDTQGEGQHEENVLIMRHISFSGHQDSFHEHGSAIKRWFQDPIRRRRNFTMLLTAILITMFVSLRHFRSSAVIPIEKAIEHRLDIGGGLSLWYRTWGNRNAIPVLFVHGGPGNAIDDYDNGNKRFFAAKDFFVVEVDQRGTGRSQPSVRDDCRNVKYYTNITIDQMSHDYELVREALKIDKWLVFGGSWGSTLGLDYATRYPERCLGLIIRGIWLNTVPEFEAIFDRRAYLSNKKRLSEFDIWLNVAAKEAERTGEPDLDPNDGVRLFRIFGRMIQRCDKSAMWHHFVWENNMMEEDPANILDPFTIDTKMLPEAMSVAFFENRLYLDGTYDNPSDLLSGIDALLPMDVWICQGLRDEVCPPHLGAQKLVNALLDSGVAVRAQFLDAGHEDTDPIMAQCLKESVESFLTTNT